MFQSTTKKKRKRRTRKYGSTVVFSEAFKQIEITESQSDAIEKEQDEQSYLNTTNWDSDASTVDYGGTDDEFEFEESKSYNPVPKCFDIRYDRKCIEIDLNKDFGIDLQFIFQARDKIFQLFLYCFFYCVSGINKI